jgi:hypothetical protein
MNWARYIWGVAAIVCGVRWIVLRKVEIGIEGRGGAFVLTGVKAALFGTGAVLIGGFVLLS